MRIGVHKYFVICREIKVKDVAVHYNKYFEIDLQYATIFF
jgi:hypothetical protein